MKKLIYIVLILWGGLLVSGCRQGEMEPKELQGSVTPVDFSAFARQAVTKGSILTPELFKTKGIGVFAFHQPAKYNGYAVDYNHNMGEPEFMYNQQVVCSSGDGTWVYTPLKYWPNNENDQLSFFAYAPYDYRTSWDEDMDITCNLEGTKFKRIYYIDSYPDDQKDYMWADPVLNLKRADISYKVQFSFMHVCAQVGFMVAVKDEDAQTASGSAASGDVTAWTDPNSDIVIKSLKLERIYETYTVSCIYNKENMPQFQNTWTGDGSQSVTLTNGAPGNIVEQGVISINPDILPEASGDAANPDWNATTWKEPTYKRLNKDDSYLFLAPQCSDEQNITFTLEYEIRTRNLKTSETNSVKRTFTHRMSDLHLDGNKFEQGRAYTIKYLIGVSGIKVSAELADWEDEQVVIEVE